MPVGISLVSGSLQLGVGTALVVLLAGLSVFLATVEASFNILKRRKLTQVGFHDEARVELAQRYLDDPPRMLMPVHLGTYTAHVGMTVIITSLAFRLVDHWAMLTAFGTSSSSATGTRVSTTACSCSPIRSSGTPKTAQSTTAGC